MNFNSIALSGVVRELAAQPDSDVVVVCEQEIPESRKRLGWVLPSMEGVEVITLDRERWQRKVHQIIEERKRGVHLFNGGRNNYPRLHFAFLECYRRQITAGIIAEPPVNQETGWRRWAKAAYIKVALRRKILPVARRAKFLLALTDPEDDSFLNLGWETEQIYPFGYFSDIAPDKELPRVSNQPPKLVYCGQFAPHKALAVLIRAAGAVRSQGHRFRLDLYGSGPLRDDLAHQIEQEGLEGTVVLREPVSNDLMAPVLRQADVLVAPGLDEPWGFAVNEGIQAGAAIVVSDGIRGGRSLVKYGRCGKIVRAGDVNDMARAIAELIGDRDCLLKFRQRAWEYSFRILPRVAAEYLSKIITHEQHGDTHRPIAPWISEIT